MHYVCKECFLDKEIRGFIISQNEKGDCCFCKNKNVEIISIVELYDFFKELVDNFKSSDNGEEFISKIQINWNFFINKEIGAEIINYVLNNINIHIKHSNDLVEFNEDILENVNYWFKLKEQLKWEKRYLTDITYLIEDLGWDGYFESKEVISFDDIFYRARLHKSANKKKYSTIEMHSPPKEISTAGRANPIGIPFLYLSDNEKTVLYEIRAAFLDEISVASFKLKDDINQEILISDFTETPSLFAPTEVNKRIKSTLLKELISRDLSKPMRRYDSEIDYIPTQFICEFIKVFTDVEGIKFQSSLHSSGNNIVIFNHEIMECVNVEKKKITKVNIDFQLIQKG